MIPQVEDLKEALFNCNWTGAPMRVRKLILLYKVLLNQPNNIDAPPFSVLNLELLCDVFKRSYYTVTILSDLLA